MKALFAAAGAAAGRSTACSSRDRPERPAIVERARACPLREAGEPRIERRREQGEDARRSSTPAARARLRLRPQGRGRGAGSTRARSRSRCSATTTPEPRVPGEIVPDREFYDYDSKYSADSRTELRIPAPLDAARARRGARRSRVARLPRRGRERATRASTSCWTEDAGRLLRERDQHHPRLHVDQHVPEAVGGQRARYPELLARARRRSGSSATPRAPPHHALRRLVARLLAGRRLRAGIQNSIQGRVASRHLPHFRRARGRLRRQRFRERTR